MTSREIDKLQAEIDQLTNEPFFFNLKLGQRSNFANFVAYVYDRQSRIIRDTAVFGLVTLKNAEKADNQKLNESHLKIDESCTGSEPDLFERNRFTPASMVKHMRRLTRDPQTMDNHPNAWLVHDLLSFQVDQPMFREGFEGKLATDKPTIDKFDFRSQILAQDSSIDETSVTNNLEKSNIWIESDFVRYSVKSMSLVPYLAYRKVERTFLEVIISSCLFWPLSDLVNLGLVQKVLGPSFRATWDAFMGLGWNSYQSLVCFRTEEDVVGRVVTRSITQTLSLKNRTKKAHNSPIGANSTVSESSR